MISITGRHRFVETHQFSLDALARALSLCQLVLSAGARTYEACVYHITFTRLHNGVQLCAMQKKNKKADARCEASSQHSADSAARTQCMKFDLESIRQRLTRSHVERHVVVGAKSATREIPHWNICISKCFFASSTKWSRFGSGVTQRNTVLLFLFWLKNLVVAVVDGVFGSDRRQHSRLS